MSSDDAYIKPSEMKNIRDWARLRIQPRMMPDDVVRLLDSHAVADSVIEELADALRAVDCGCRGHGEVPCAESTARRKALARVDALNETGSALDGIARLSEDTEGGYT